MPPVQARHSTSCCWLSGHGISGTRRSTARKGQETRITHYPGHDEKNFTWQDAIITFPADSGVPPLYLVFAKPALQPLEVGTYGSFAGRLRNGLEADQG
nr:S-type pyocin domain-containing protein [Pseudomonas gingeri]